MRLVSIRTRRSLHVISIHAPMKSATHCRRYSWRYLSDFNPRTHEGCDKLLQLSGGAIYDISIHAPMKGATQLLRRATRLLLNFNPRTHEGCDAARTVKCRPNGHNFNPRTHEGCDNIGHIGGTGGNIISIHAPMKGATESCPWFMGRMT